jgi:uridine phosphorylase
VIEALGASRVEDPLFYGTRCYAATRDKLNLAVLPQVIYGGPVTANLLEELACLGVKTAIGIGAAGALISQAHMGQLFIAERAGSQDGTSRAYVSSRESRPSPGSGPWAVPDPQLLALSRSLAAREAAEPLLGTVWTTDALYQERPSRLDSWREAGADFVNLECGPFYAVAQAKGIRAVYLGLVTDHLSAEQGWRDDHWGRESPADTLIIRVLLGLVDALAGKEFADV